jgi:Lipocalin-like domain
MNRRSVLCICTMTTMALAMVPGGAAAQQKSLKDQLVGTWTFVSSTAKLADGNPVWGPNSKGQLSLDANGRYSTIIVRSDLAKYASNNRMQTAPAEDKATVQGAIALFGTYTVNEADRSYTIRVDGSSYPNWNGTDRKQFVESITADELKIRNPAPSIGGPPTQLIYRRAK